MRACRQRPLRLLSWTTNSGLKRALPRYRFALRKRARPAWPFGQSEVLRGEHLRGAIGHARRACEAIARATGRLGLGASARSARSLWMVGGQVTFGSAAGVSAQECIGASARRPAGSARLQHEDFDLAVRPRSVVVKAAILVIHPAPQLRALIALGDACPHASLLTTDLHFGVRVG